MLKELLGALWTQEIEDALTGKVEVIGSETRIPKSRFDEVNTEKNDLKIKVDELMNQLQEATKASENVEVLNTRIGELQSEYDTFVKNVETEKVNGVKRSALVKMLKEKHNALNPELLIGKYDLGVVTIADDGTIVGAKETTDSLLTQYPEQFGKVTETTPKPENNPTKTKPFGEMSTVERIELKQKDPDGYAKAREAWYNSK